MLRKLNRISQKSILSLFDPVSKDEFADRYWASRPMYCGSAVHHSILGELDPLPDLANCLAIPSILAHLECQVRKPLSSTSVSSIQDLIQNVVKGDTLQLRMLQTVLSPRHPLIRIADELSLFLGHPLDSVSIFISPPYSQAIVKHFDETEIFTLQLSGRKHWSFFDMQIDHEIELSSGDLLYSPSRCWHEVKSSAETSVSVAFIYKPIRLNDVISELVEDIFSEDPLTSITMPILNQGLQKIYSKISPQAIRSMESLALGRITLESILQKARHQALKYSTCIRPNIKRYSIDQTVRGDLYRHENTQFTLQISEKCARIVLATRVTIQFPAFVGDELHRILSLRPGKRVEAFSKFLDHDEFDLVLQWLIAVSLLRVVQSTNPDHDHEFYYTNVLELSIARVLARSNFDDNFRQLALQDPIAAFRQVGVQESELLFVENITFHGNEREEVQQNSIALPTTSRMRLISSDIIYIEAEEY